MHYVWSNKADAPIGSVISYRPFAMWVSLAGNVLFEQSRKHCRKNLVINWLLCKIRRKDDVRLVIGGQEGDAGLTCRKIKIYTYGGWGAHGGGEFSGKDPTKVDSYAAYASHCVEKKDYFSRLDGCWTTRSGFVLNLHCRNSVHISWNIWNG